MYERVTNVDGVPYFIFYRELHTSQTFAQAFNGDLILTTTCLAPHPTPSKRLFKSYKQLSSVT